VSADRTKFLIEENWSIGISENWSTSYDSRIISYNMHDWNQGKSLLSELYETNFAKLSFVQEHWLTPANMVSKLYFSDKYNVFGISSMERAVSLTIYSEREASWG